MKFRAICAMLTLVIGLWSSAPALDLGLGVKGGLNLSRTYGVEDAEGVSMRPGLVAGAAFQLKLAKSLRHPTRNTIFMQRFESRSF